MLDDADDLLIYLFLFAAAMAGGPSLLAAVGVDAGAWLVSSQVLVPPGESVFVLPLVGAGVDERRAVILGLVVVLGLVAGVTRVARRSRESG